MAEQVDKAVAGYVRVFLTHVIQDGLLQPIYQEIIFLQNQFKEFPTLQHVLQNPTVFTAEKRRLLGLLYRSDTPPILKKFIDFLVNQRQAGQLRAMLYAFEKAYHVYRGVQSVVLTTAVALPEDCVDKLMEKVKKRFSCKEIKLTQQIDPSVMGGYKLQIGTLQWDKTIKHSLYALQKHLVKGI
ncbi:MAG: ATP synthase F1 subunit delta [Candidatus Cardinium sp.]|nr:ATP synthase F1 subunit delta [Candidatus Cardinium sp.]